MLKFHVADMSCGHCAGVITKAVKDADPEATVNIDLAAHMVLIEGAADVNKVQQAIREAGYTPLAQP
ncbi:MAG: heavy metal transport/detoxification protein [Burkholderiaceae bacterium]|nr:heavy metal transport/detoxification protein [Burkholderiaceae bacterium]